MQCNLPPGEREILERHGLSGQRTLIDLSKIDFDKSSRNQARDTDPLNAEHVEDLVFSIKQGAKIPELVVARDGNKFVVWSGRHRLEAYKKSDAKQLWAYVVETTDARLWDMVPRWLNRSQGLKLTRQQKLSAALWDSKTYGVTLEEAGMEVGLSSSSISRYSLASKMHSRLETLGVPSNKLSETHLLKLNQLSDSDHVLAEVAGIAVRCNLTAEQLTSVIGAVKSHTTESARLTAAKEKKLELVGEDFKSNGSTNKKRDRRIDLKILMSRMESFLQKISSVKQVGFTDKREIEIVNERLKKLASELRRVSEGKARRAATPA